MAPGSEHSGAYSVRPAVKADAAALRELRLRGLRESPESFGSAFEEEEGLSVEDFAARIPEGGDDVIYVAVQAGRLMGMVGFAREKRLKARHKADIWGMYVAPEGRGMGMGRALIEALLAHARGLEGVAQVLLTVTMTNEPAVRLYESAGFRVWGTEPDGLRVGSTAYVDYHMLCRL